MSTGADNAAVVAVIQARMSSSRLPGKVLRDLNGRPVLAHVVERARAIPGIDRVVVATSTQPIDILVVELAEACGAAAFRGSENDVLDRYYQAASVFQAKVVMRLTADCPLLDPAVSGAVLRRFLEGGADYVSNVRPPSFPDGLDTEVFSMEALTRAWKAAADPMEREHVTRHIARNRDRFVLANLASPEDLSKHRWTLDYEEDLRLIRAVYAALGPQNCYDHRQVLAWLKAHAEIQGLNQNLHATCKSIAVAG